MWVQSLGREDPLEVDTAIHPSSFAWRIPWTEETSGLQLIGSQKVKHDWRTKHTLARHTGIPQTEGLNQQKFISHGLRGCMSKQDAGWLNSWWECSSWLETASSLCAFSLFLEHILGGERELSPFFFLQGHLTPSWQPHPQGPHL